MALGPDNKSAATGLIIVVNYNQELEIARFLTELDAQLTTDKSGLDVVVVDDGSQDRSPEIAEERGYKVLRHGHNRGVGAGIRTGILYAKDEGRYDYVVIMSSNGKMRPSELGRVTEPIVAGRADYVQGSRFLKGGRSLNLTGFRKSAIPAFTLFASAMLKRRFTDITCGFRAYRLALFDDPAVQLEQSWLDRYEMEYYIHYHACRSPRGIRIEEVPVTIDYSHLSEGRKSKIVPLVGWWSMTRPFVYLVTGIKH